MAGSGQAHIRSRRVVAALVGAALLVAAAGCGSGGTDADDDAGSVVLRAVDTTKSVHTASFTEDFIGRDEAQASSNATPSSDSQQPAQHVDGAVDFDAETGWSRMSTPAVPGAQPPETRFTADAVYVSISSLAPNPAEAGFAGIDWIRVDRPSLPHSALTFAGVVDNPFDALAQLRAGSTSVVERGAQTIDGVATTEYVVTLDRAKYAAARDLPKRLVTRDELTMHVWLDHDDRLRQVENRVAEITLRTKLARFGADVSVDVPTGDRVYDATADRVSFEAPDFSHLGRWAELAAGQAGTVPWSVWTQRNDKGAACWTIEPDPDPAIGAMVMGGDVPDDFHSEHNGIDATCMPQPAAGFSHDPIEFLMQSTLDDGNSQLLVAVTVPGVTDARLTLGNGTSTVVPVANGVFVWSGPTQVAPTRIEATLPGGRRAECTPFGTQASGSSPGLVIGPTAALSCYTVLKR